VSHTSFFNIIPFLFIRDFCPFAWHEESPTQFGILFLQESLVLLESSCWLVSYSSNISFISPSVTKGDLEEGEPASCKMRTFPDDDELFQISLKEKGIQGLHRQEGRGRTWRSSSCPLRRKVLQLLKNL
jgi:hypothetical protein